MNYEDLYFKLSHCNNDFSKVSKYVIEHKNSIEQKYLKTILLYILEHGKEEDLEIFLDGLSDYNSILNNFLQCLNNLSNLFQIINKKYESNGLMLSKEKNKLSDTLSKNAQLDVCSDKEIASKNKLNKKEKSIKDLDDAKVVYAQSSFNQKKGKNYKKMSSKKKKSSLFNHLKNKNDIVYSSENKFAYDSRFKAYSFDNNFVIVNEYKNSKFEFLKRIFRGSKKSKIKEFKYDPRFDNSRNNEFIFPISDEEVDDKKIQLKKGIKSICNKLSSFGKKIKKIVSSFDLKNKKKTIDNYIEDKKVLKINRVRKPYSKLLLNKKVVASSLILALTISSTAIAFTHNFNSNNKTDDISKSSFKNNGIISNLEMVKSNELFFKSSNFSDLDKNVKEMISNNYTKSDLNDKEIISNNCTKSDLNDKEIISNNYTKSDLNDKNKESVETVEEDIFINIGDVVTVDTDNIYSDVYSAKDRINGTKPYYKKNTKRDVKGALFTLDGKNVYCTSRDEVNNIIDAGGIVQSYVVGNENGFEGAYNADDVVFCNSSQENDFVKSNGVKVLYKM